MDRIGEYVNGVIHSVEIPDVRQTANKLWLDISRYGPVLPEVHIPRFPGLGDFEIPPPPVPPPPPPTWYESTLYWTHDNPWRASGIAVGVLGTSLLVGYATVPLRSRHRRVSKSHDRRQVVVVLGADVPHGEALVAGLEHKGYIVLASVATAEAADALELKSSGYVKALVLDPSQPATVPIFLRSLSSCLSRRFPLNSPGDPFAPLSAIPYIHSVISLMQLALPPTNAPLEHISLHESFLPYLNSSSVVPLRVIQALLPLLRAGSGRHSPTQKSLVFCVPAMLARVGLPFQSIQSMSTANTLRAAEILRREVTAAALTDKTDSMKNIRVVVVDVGAFNVTSSNTTLSAPEDVYKAMEGWTPSEKMTYGPSFAAVSYQSTSNSTPSAPKQHPYGVPRRPTDISIFVDNLVGVVKCDFGGPKVFGLTFSIGKLRNWWKGERFAIGAGATTYQWASHLPPIILDTLLSIPHYLISFRNSLLDISRTHRVVRPPRPQHPPTPPTTTALTVGMPISNLGSRDRSPGSESLPSSEHDSGNEASSEAEVESNSGYEPSNVTDSWISLNEHGSSVESGKE